jgi:hypothetical protein
MSINEVHRRLQQSAKDEHTTTSTNGEHNIDKKTKTQEAGSRSQ